jgi:pilus assembly protein CpaC
MDTRISRALAAAKDRLYVYGLCLVLAASLALSFPAQAGAANAVKTEVVVGKSAIMTLPAAVSRVSLADPAIADVLVLTPRELQINGKKIGSTSLIVWDKAGTKTFFDVDVIIDNSQLKDRLAEIAPGDDVQVKVVKDSVIVSGTVKSPDRLLRINAILDSYKGDGVKVVNLVEVGEMPQVLLQITVASMDRKAARDLGINWSYSEAHLTVDSAVSSLTGGLTSISGLLAGSTTSGLTSDVTGATFSVVDWHNGTQYLLKALASKGLAKILAEPNLLVKSGATGHFVAGGEFPYPVIQSGSSGGVTPVTIHFKEFGVRMNFQPVVKESGLIQLNMGRPPQPSTVITGKDTFTQFIDNGESGIEVSSLDYANSVTVPGSNFRVPALKKDAVSTNVDLKEGESFIIAGLINEEWSKNLNKLPLLGDIPILGAFFRDQSMSKTERELIFIITPKIMKPMPPGQRAELPGANEPTSRQIDDLRWVPLLPTYRSNDAEQLK